MMRLVSLLFLGVATPLLAADVEASKIQPKVEAALKAYNKDDTKTFYKDWTDADTQEERNRQYNVYFKTFIKPMYGTYKEKSLKFTKIDSTSSGDTPVLLWEAEFTKNKKVKVETSLIKSEGELKFFAIRISDKK